ncbi:MAG TPA: ABC transporter permease [Ilumatobacteraceae bacterium]|nr:ABC transporter permease [Ilumatobacteraceae bacterium]
MPESTLSARLKRIVNPAQAQNRQQLMLTLASSLFAIVLALAVGSLILAISGKDWTALFSKMGANLSDRGKLVNTLREATPLMISAVAVAIGFKMNMFNIGVEGQWLMGAFFGAVVGAQFSLPAPLHIAVIFLVAAAAGAAWASIAGVLKVSRGVNEVIATIMLNALVNNVLQFLFDEYFRFTKPGGTLDVKTKPIPSTGWLPDIGHWIPGIPRGQLSSAFILALVMVFGYWLLVFKSRFGFRLRASGGNATAAATGGINSKKLIIISMALSGAVAGLVGMDYILAQPSHAWGPSHTTGYGFDGISVALLGRNNPLGILVSALLFGFLDTLVGPLQLAKLPSAVIPVIKAVILLSVVIVNEVVGVRMAKRTSERAAAELELAGVAA